VILEDFAQMTPAKTRSTQSRRETGLDAHVAHPARLPDQVHTGNYMFIYGEDVAWPEARVLVGAHKELFNLQYKTSGAITC